MLWEMRSLPKMATISVRNWPIRHQRMKNTREQSDKNIDKFNRLVVYDEEEVRKTKYNSEIRGRVQDRNVRVDLEPMFVLTYYEKVDPVKKLVYYDKMVEAYNSRLVLERKLRITKKKPPLRKTRLPYILHLSIIFRPV